MGPAVVAPEDKAERPKLVADWTALVAAWPTVVASKDEAGLDEAGRRTYTCVDVITIITTVRFTIIALKQCHAWQTAP